MLLANVKVVAFKLQWYGQGNKTLNSRNNIYGFIQIKEEV